MLDGSQSVFGPEPLDAALRERVASQDIHGTGPMWGLGALRSTGAVAALEAQVASAHAELCAGLEAAGLKQERRALRVRVRDLQWRWLDADALELAFALMPGSYATELLAELGPVSEANRF
jgi:tRNA pseudouridine13 synthase